MKITLLGEDGVRLEEDNGPMSIEAERPDQVYSPYHMLGSALGFCEHSLLRSWATHAKLPADDLVIEVRWTFIDEPHQVGHMDLKLIWPSLPEARRNAAKRAAELCPVHRTLQHSPTITTEIAGELMATVPVVQFRVAGAGIPAGVGVGLGRPYTVVYDGHCNICGKLVRALAKWDRHGLLELIPSQAPGVHARFPWIPARAYMDSVQLVGPGGQTWQGAAAVERILDVMPRGRLITWVFSIPYVRVFAEWFYRWFARNRYRLGCGEHCEYRPPAIDFGEGA